MNEPVEPASVLHFEPGGEPRSESRELLQEAPLTIRIAGRPDVTLARTPGADRDLVIGFLLTAGLIRGPADVLALDECGESGDTVRVTLPGEAPLDGTPPLEDGARFPVQVLFDVPGLMREAQRLFERTGASHAAALFNAAGELLAVREDIGRYNALDKVVGRAVLAAWTLKDCGVLLSCRASFEMVAKAARAGLPLAAAVSAPSALAVALAERLNLTLCGFVRGKEVTCYAHPERLVR